jgi:hypothetical protein
MRGIPRCVEASLSPALRAQRRAGFAGVRGPRNPLRVKIIFLYT